MTDYVPSALFIYTQESESLCEQIESNPFGVDITLVAYDTLLRNPQKWLENAEHVVVSSPLSVLKKVTHFALDYRFSLGLIPLSEQKELIKALSIPKSKDDAIELALRKDAQWVDIVLCNGEILLFKATIGRIPLLDTPSDISPVQALTKVTKNFKGLRLLQFEIQVSGKPKIKTAASGCMIVQHYSGSLASRLITNESSATDGMLSLIIVSPFSHLAYLNFLLQLYKSSIGIQRLPKVIGYIKSRRIDIEPESPLNVVIDGETVTQTPLHCETLPKAIRINAGPWLKEENKKNISSREKVKVENLPKGKELNKAKEKKIPFFSYASEERFRDLFMALREDAEINGIYLVLMLLSTLLATVGLYLNSSAVIIGAMLLAPLMAPIVSLAMGLLRNDHKLLTNSIYKILIGIFLALLASSLVSLSFTYKPITDEMQGRLNPSLLDLAVAIISGIAAAYSKSFKEIIQSLAGVAIAVALVPPLAVAGIGLGRGDFYFFLQPFLLFSTNLVGIVLAAAFTFRILGFSPAVHNKRHLGIVILALIMISIPLYFSYERIATKVTFEQRLQKERFLVNGKYIIIQKADISRQENRSIIIMKILARETLSRNDLNTLQKKFQHYFDTDLVIRTEIIYIL